MARSFFSVAVVAIALASTFASVPAFAGPMQGAPGPIAGAGLPVLAVGYGAYWLVKRFRRKTD
jgi:hypothetical protein